MDTTVKKAQAIKTMTSAAVVGGGARRANAETSHRPLAAQAITQGPKHHYFGYYELCPWDVTSRYVLGMETDFFHRGQTAEDVLTIGMIDTATGNQFIPLGQTHAWNWQQGCFLQWLPSASGKEIIYNDCQEGRFVSVIRNIETGVQRVLPRPVAAVSHDGKTALSINFARLYDQRPGYGYAGAADPYAEVNAPEDDGIYFMDLQTGDYRLILSLAQVAKDYFPASQATPKVWFNHLQYNRDDSRFVFLMRYPADNNPPWLTGMFTAALDGSTLYRLAGHTSVSHFDWCDRERILAWTYRPEYGEAFYLCTDQTQQYEAVGLNYLTRDGHCCYSPDRRWILDDTYPDKDGIQVLKLWHVAGQREIILGHFPSPRKFWGGEAQLRCDLHPRWSRDGQKICFDSTQDGSRQVYVIDVSSIVNG